MTATDCGCCGMLLALLLENVSLLTPATADRVDAQVQHFGQARQTDDVTLLLVDLCTQLSGDHHV